MTFAQYYQAELAYLREMGRAFGVSHPAIAGMLAERGGDPDVQRLLEGFSFLTARLRQRIDQAMPTLLESLTELLVPQLVRPLPSATIVQFTPQPRALRGRQRVPQGTQLAARPIDGTSCTFRTTEPIDLVPAAITRQRLDDAHPSRPRIVLDLAIARGGHEAVFSAPIRLHLHGELALTSQLYLWLARHCRSITLTSGAIAIPIAPSALSARGFDAALWPSPKFAPKALGLLTEYFTLPSKFLFVDLSFPASAAKLGDETVQLQIELERPPPLSGPLPQDTFRLHCVPAVNLFAIGADPIRFDALTRPQLLRASGLPPEHMEVHTVDAVTGVHADGGRAQYQPFLGFQHTIDEDPRARYFVVGRELSPVDGGFHHFLSLASPRGAPPDLGRETLSVELTCTNRSLPNELGIGDLCVPTPGSPTGIPFQNIGLFSRPARPPLGTLLCPRLLAHLAASRRGLMDLDALRTLLHLYNFQQTADHPAGRVNHARIAALEGLREQGVTRMIENAPVRGTKVTLTAREEGFVSKGDAFLFASVLDRIYGMQVHVNTFSELGFELLPSNESMGWAPRWRS